MLATRYRLSADQYHRMIDAGVFAPEDRIELLEGELTPMAPAGDDHSYGTQRLLNLFAAQAGGRAFVMCQCPLLLGDDSEPEPDVMLVDAARGFPAKPAAADVLLLVEVADSSLQRDRDVKLPLYAAAGIPEVWIADCAGRCVLVFRDPSGGGYRQSFAARPGETIEALAGFSVAVADVFRAKR